MRAKRFPGPTSNVAAEAVATISDTTPAIANTHTRPCRTKPHKDLIPVLDFVAFINLPAFLGSPIYVIDELNGLTPSRKS
jgi:hypothetical protein